MQAGVQDHAIFADEIRHDRFRDTPADQLLTGLRGKDVLLVFVESYGQVAVQDSSFSPQVDAALDAGDQAAAGRRLLLPERLPHLADVRRHQLAGALHLQSGLWVDNQLRYDQLVKTDRFTLSDAFKRAGWRTVGDVPSNNRAWPEGTSFYHYDKLYDRRNVGYRGPTFAYASMPDQYVLVGPPTPRAREDRPPLRSSRRSTSCRATRRGRASRS